MKYLFLFVLGAVLSVATVAFAAAGDPVVAGTVVDQAVAWLHHPLWLGGAAGVWILLFAGVVIEWALGRFAPTRCKSLIAVIATGLRFLLLNVIPVGRIPGVGPVIIGVLESVAGVDLDGDGKVGAVERATAIAKKVEAVEGLPPGTVTKDP